MCYFPLLSIGRKWICLNALAFLSRHPVHTKSLTGAAISLHNLKQQALAGNSRVDVLADQTQCYPESIWSQIDIVRCWTRQNNQPPEYNTCEIYKKCQGFFYVKIIAKGSWSGGGKLWDTHFALIYHNDDTVFTFTKTGAVIPVLKYHIIPWPNSVCWLARSF